MISRHRVVLLVATVAIGLLVFGTASAGVWTSFSAAVPGSPQCGTDYGADAPPLTLETGQDITIDLACGMSAGYRAGLRVISPSGAFLLGDAFSSVYGDCPNPVSFNFIAPETGDYQIRISNSCLSPSGQTLTANITGLPVPSSEPVPDPEPVPGCDVFIPLTETSVVGQFVDNAVAYWMPGEATDIVIEAGNTAWVLGMDDSGAYYKIVWSCELLWVPVGSMGPNYDGVWNGTPLPSAVVE